MYRMFPCTDILEHAKTSYVVKQRSTGQKVTKVGVTGLVFEIRRVEKMR